MNAQSYPNYSVGDNFGPVDQRRCVFHGSATDAVCIAHTSEHAKLIRDALNDRDALLDAQRTLKACFDIRMTLLEALECADAALNQNATFPADVALARRVIRDAIAKTRE